MKRACIVARAAHQKSWGGSFAAGLMRHGWNVEIRETARDADLVVLWGVRNRPAIAAAKGEICILERGYIGDRLHWTSVSFGGGLNGRAQFRGVSDDRSRFETHFGALLQPWSTKPAGYALLIGQVPGDMSLAALNGDLGDWYRQAAAALQDRGLDVRFRPHPVALQRRVTTPLPPVPVMNGALADAIAGAGVVATFNSNTGVESVLAGTPTYVADPGGMAWPVAAHDLAADPVTPDRETWAAELAWKQWSMDEMRSGECWARVGGEA